MSQSIKLNVGDSLRDPMSGNNGEILKIEDHVSGKLVFIRWRVEDHLHHDTEHFYSKLVKSVKKGEIEHSPLTPS